MNKNIMCVCASRDAANIGFYEVDVFDNKIGTIKLDGLKITGGLNSSELVDLIFDLCDGFEYSAIIIDGRSNGISIIDALEKEEEFTTPIVKSIINTSKIADSTNLLRGYVSNKKFILGEDSGIKISSVKKYLNTNEKIDFSKCNETFENIVHFCSVIEDILCNKNQNKIKIENNLREVLDILVEDLHNLDKTNPLAVNDLVRLIDKVNYIRGQY